MRKRNVTKNLSLLRADDLIHEQLILDIIESWGKSGAKSYKLGRYVCPSCCAHTGYCAIFPVPHLV